MLESINLTLSAKGSLIGLLPLVGETMPNVEIYTWQFCPFCIRAKALLDKKGISYQEHQIDGDHQAREKMAERAEGRTSVPQIFIDNKGIGGCDELYQLEKQKQLNNLLNL